MSYVIAIDKSYNNYNAIENMVKYGLRIDDSQLDKSLPVYHWDGFGVNTLTPNDIIESFNMVKRLTCKDDGKELYHVVLSIYRYAFNPMDHRITNAEIILYDVGNMLYDNGYINIGFIHTDSMTNNVHIHFVIDSINYKTGYKIKNSHSFYCNILSFLRKNHNSLQWTMFTKY